MVITEQEAIRILVLIGYYLHKEKLTINNLDCQFAEELGEVKLARRIGEEFPSLISHVEVTLKGG